MVRGQLLPIYVSFATWLDVHDAIQDHTPLYYHAPLDRFPVSVYAVKVFKNGKIRIETPGLTFTCDEGHLSRFCTRGVAANPSLPQPPTKEGV